MVGEILRHALPKSNVALLLGLKPYVYRQNYTQTVISEVSAENNFRACGLILIVEA